MKERREKQKKMAFHETFARVIGFLMLPCRISNPESSGIPRGTTEETHRMILVIPNNATLSNRNDVSL